VASSVHRRGALEAVSWTIEEIKRTLPMWKKEVYYDDREPKWKVNPAFEKNLRSKVIDY